MDVKRTPVRIKACGNCAHATTTAKPTRMHCHREPTPALMANGEWPNVFYDDVCGYHAVTLETR